MATFIGSAIEGAPVEAITEPCPTRFKGSVGLLDAVFAAHDGHRTATAKIQKGRNVLN